MNRRNFLKNSLLAGAVATAAPLDLLGAVLPETPQISEPSLKLSFGESTVPGKTLEERLVQFQELGIEYMEVGGRTLARRVPEFDHFLRGTNVKIGAVCAGFQGFILSEDVATKTLFDATMREIIDAAGALGSVGVVMVPAFNSQVPAKAHTPETRAFLIDELRELGEYAYQRGTSVILEPLNRQEAFYLRQVADAASICRDANHPGVRCMGDFWHMTFEESSDYGALMSGGQYLTHMHIASRNSRQYPGMNGDKDNYVEGFRALKELNYDGLVCFECNAVSGDRMPLLKASVELLKEQWEQA